MRIPYEESSVYNELDPLSPSELESYPPDFEYLQNPGDILLVPKHWWHFVVTESDFALSINAWQEQTSDSHERLNEAMTRFCFGAILSALKEANYFENDQNGCTLNSWISPSEMDEHGHDAVTDHVRNYEYLKMSMQECGVENFHKQIRFYVQNILQPDVVKTSLGVGEAHTL